MDKLKPCPFCGSAVELKIGLLGSPIILCDKCGADVRFHGAEIINKEIEAWNRRAEDAAD